MITNDLISKYKKTDAKKGDVPDWISEGGVIDSLISRRIYEILLGNYDENLIKSFDKYSKIILKNILNMQKMWVSKKELFLLNSIQKKIDTIFIHLRGMRVNALLSTIFSLEYDIYSPKDTAYYSSFKFKGQSSFDNIVEVINKVEEILNAPDINSLIDEKTQKFVKNKFINFLPYEDNVKLKMELLYNTEDLLKIIKNNSVKLIGSTKFKHW